MELIKTGDLPLTPLGLEKMRSDLGLSKEATKSLYRRSKANEPKQLLTQLPRPRQNHRSNSHLQGWG